MEKVTVGYRCKCIYCGKKFMVGRKDGILFGSSRHVRCPICKEFQNMGVGLIDGNVGRIWKKK